MKNKEKIVSNQRMIAFLFDSDLIDEIFYGDVIFEKFIEGMEITKNTSKVIFSVGDIIDQNIYDDITPFVISDEICTVKTRSTTQSRQTPFVFLLEDIEVEIAITIDERLKKDFPAYIGMTSIDINSTDSRKQFWKMLIRVFSIHKKEIMCFGSKEEDSFSYGCTARNNGFNINYDECLANYCFDDDSYMPLSRQSSFITSEKQREIVKGPSDSDRGKLEMNFSLVREVSVAGTLIWKAMEDINQVYFTKYTKNNYIYNAEYVFISLYEASQGIERLLKIVIELIAYGNKDANDKEKIDELLYSHNHSAMYDYISKKKNLSLKTNSLKFLNILNSFYSIARYNRFKHTSERNLEVKLMQNFGHDIDEKDFDNQLKHSYGKAIGSIAQSLYKLIKDLSQELNIYVYELNDTSVSDFSLCSYYGEDLYALLKQTEQAKKELMFFLMKHGKEQPSVKLSNNMASLPFEKNDLTEYIADLITNKDSCHTLHDFVSHSYDMLVTVDKTTWKKRIETIDSLIGNKKVIFDELDDDYE